MKKKRLLWIEVLVSVIVLGIFTHISQLKGLGGKPPNVCGHYPKLLTL